MMTKIERKDDSAAEADLAIERLMHGKAISTGAEAETRQEEL